MTVIDVEALPSFPVELAVKPLVLGASSMFARSFLYPGTDQAARKQRQRSRQFHTGVLS